MFFTRWIQDNCMEDWKRGVCVDQKVTCKLLSRSSTAPPPARSHQEACWPAGLHWCWRVACYRLVIATRFNFRWSHPSSSPELSVSSKDHISVCLLLTHMHTHRQPPPTPFPTHTSHTFLHLPTNTNLLVRIDFPSKSIISVQKISFRPVLCFFFFFLLSGEDGTSPRLVSGQISVQWLLTC